MSIEINGTVYVKAEGLVKTVPAICNSKLLVENLGDGKVKCTLDDEPSIIMTIDSGSTGKMTFQRIRDVKVLD